MPCLMWSSAPICSTSIGPFKIWQFLKHPDSVLCDDESYPDTPEINIYWTATYVSKAQTVREKQTKLATVTPKFTQ